MRHHKVGLTGWLVGLSLGFLVVWALCHVVILVGTLAAIGLWYWHKKHPHAMGRIAHVLFILLVTLAVIGILSTLFVR
jgi:hypothetical protein